MASADNEADVTRTTDPSAPLSPAARIGIVASACVLVAVSAGITILLIDSSARIGERDTVLHELVRDGDIDRIIRACDRDPDIVDRADRNGDLPLQVASECWKPEVVKVLVERGADVDAAAPGSRTPLIRACVQEDMETVRLLLELGADPDLGVECEDVCPTPMHTAVVCGSRECAELLVSHGANVDIRDSYGTSALNYALEPNGSIEMVEFLIEKGACVNPPDESCRNHPLMQAATFGNEEGFARLIAAGARLAVRDADGNGLLHHAADSHDPHAVRMLLAAGLDPHLKNRDGDTPLDLLRRRKAESPREQVEAFASDYAETEELLAAEHYR